MRKFLTETAFVAFILLFASGFWMLTQPTVKEYVEVEVRPVVLANLDPEPLAYSYFYRSPAKIELSAKDFECLARNIYYEAVGEDYIGKIAVAQVTWNRVKAGRWGKTVCHVVHAPFQFSWTRMKKRLPAGPGWEESKRAARDFLNGRRVAGLDRSKYYHATWIQDPDWTNRMEVAVVIGQHKFYNRPD
jgi:spore germination cell wall hydrolase CwlJ-like protein